MKPKKKGHEFGRVLKELRITEKLSLCKAAKKMSLYATNLSKVEEGQVGPPRNAARIRRMARCLGREDRAEFLIDLAHRFHLAKFQEEFFGEDRSDRLPLSLMNVKALAERAVGELRDLE